MINSKLSSKRLNSKSISKFFFLIAFSLFLAVGASAQTGGGAPSGPTGDDGGATDPDTPVPFDGGVSLLVAAGVAYGVKQWRNNHKDQNNEEGKTI